jgi:hypothetical protein
MGAKYFIALKTKSRSSEVRLAKRARSQDLALSYWRGMSGGDF